MVDKLSINFLYSKKVKITPKICDVIGKPYVNFEKEGGFWKYALFGIDIEKVLPVVNLSLEGNESTQVLSYLINDILQPFIAAPFNRCARKVYFQVFQKLDLKGHCCSREGYNHIWVCKIHLHKDVIMKLHHVFPKGFKFDLTLENTTMSTAVAPRTATKPESSLVENIVVHKPLYSELSAPTVQVGLDDDDTYPCVRAVFLRLLPFELVSDLDDKLWKLKRNANYNQALEGNLSLVLTTDYDHSLAIPQRSLYPDLLNNNMPFCYDTWAPIEPKLVPINRATVTVYRPVVEDSNSVFKEMLAKNFTGKWDKPTKEQSLYENVSESDEAMITFLNTGDITQINKCPRGAVELLMFCSRYKITVLDEKIKCMLLAKLNNSFVSLEDVFLVYIFSRDVEGMSLHEDMARTILKRRIEELLRADFFFNVCAKFSINKELILKSIIETG